MPKVTFIDPAGRRHVVEASNGETLLDAARRNDVAVEGACEGAMSCSTCHVIVDPADFRKLPEATADEREMLDLAYGLERTSRLGCQIVLSDRLEGMTVRLAGQYRV